MLKFPGYHLEEKLFESNNSLVYRARKSDDPYSVILKILRDEHPSPKQIARFKQEFETTRRFQFDGIINAYELISHQYGWLMVLEDFGGESLTRLRKMGHLTLNIAESIELAIRLADIMGYLHQQNLIHKDINPSNIVWNPKTNQLKVIDFGISTLLPRETIEYRSPNSLEGTLAYLSPEQTGRMNRSIDYRTDFYSLGVTLYELLTGQLPFDSRDPMELVHAHIAKIPQKPCDLNPDIPPILSAVVFKLLAKNAEDRYQSACGLKADLKRVNDIITKQDTASFTLGENDLATTLQIPQKLYGREEEINTLLSAFERVSSGKVEMLAVAGYSGIGKTSLVQEVHKPIVKKRGHFIAGKFDQYKRNVPYAAFIEAFQNLTRQLLAESDENIAGWKTKILKAIEPNGQIIVEIIPEIELIIGQQPAVPELAPTESQNRFNYIFERFIRVFAAQEHPLTMFLDDLQWIDLPSLKLIELFMNDAETHFLFIIGAYRDNEVDETHPLTMSVAKLKTLNCAINFITLSTLPASEVNKLIADMIHHPLENTQALSEIVHSKTGGNPFFMLRFIDELYRQEFLRFDPLHATWIWDLKAIEQAGFTDNVIEFMLKKIGLLPHATRETLKFAAAMGTQFTLNMLSRVMEKTGREIAEDLWPALHDPFILPANENYRYVGLSEIETFSEDAKYQFAHDRIQQAAYLMIPADNLPALHLKIGKLMNTNQSDSDKNDRLFEIVNHFNIGRQLITNNKEIEHLAGLNLSAARKAKTTSAFDMALKYYEIGMELLANDAWKLDYQTAYDMHYGFAEMLYLNKQYDRSQKMISAALTKIESEFEKIAFYCLLINHLTIQTKYDEAIRTGLDALARLEVSIPKTDLLAETIEEITQLKELIGQREISSLADLPLLTDERIIAVIRLMSSMAAATFHSNQELFMFIFVKMVAFSIRYGNFPASCNGYVHLGVILCSLQGDYKTAYAFGRLSLLLAKRFNDDIQICRAINIIANFLQPWIKPMDDTEAMNLEGFETGKRSGELEYAGYCITHRAHNDFFMGKNLQVVSEKLGQAMKFSKQTANHHEIQRNSALIRAMSYLTSDPGKSLNIDTDASTEEQFIKDCRDSKILTSLGDYFIFKAQTLYISDYVQEARQVFENHRDVTPYSVSRFPSVLCNFFHSLTLIACYPEADDKDKTKYLTDIEANQKQMKIWADNCAESFLHKYLLVKAELARINGDALAAIDLYDQAIASAREAGFTQNEALANELAARFWLARNKPDIARLYMTRAHYCYQLWGATRKVQHLEEKFPQLLIDNIRQKIITSTESSSTKTSLLTTLDVNTLIKTSQAISAEIRLDGLLKKIMQLMIENVGAQKGVFVLERDSQFYVEAAGSVDNEIIVQSSLLHDAGSTSQPAAVIRYVLRTGKELVLDHAGESNEFGQDAYVRHQRVKSVLCAPIVSKKKQLGAVYLENNLISGAFTLDRLNVIKVLAAQAAISIENAGNHDDLENLIAERTKQLTQTNEQLHEAVEQKEAMMREVLHRTKNNLSTITSLIRLQAARTDNNIIKNSFSEIENRIRAMVLIQKNLYQSKDITQVDLDKYLGDLAVNVLLNLQAERDSIRLLMDLDNVIVIPDTAVFCGLILNELLTNAIKYAFPHNGQGTITFSLRQNNNHVELNVADDGVGLPEDFSLQHATTFGIKLINTFVRQLKGSFTLITDHGVKVNIHFPNS